ncbi:hypothetical protein POM88_026411 [Heracleum sosnowskyi]|uniref:Uncharacterized protein n=1 Tax=Heracleum sosnowskyi TaxID=360622 RepID=A0AAD8MNW2_9APIA|nr:hypothetical protein POM88_026411 [Heracleum sosnowskyi]
MSTTTVTANSPLSTTTDHQETPTIIVEQCSSCKSTKRRPFQENLDDQENDQHLSKKPNLSQLANQFTNIHISDTLLRTFSAPISPPVHPSFFNPFTPENDSKTAQGLMQRCVSDPTPVLGFPVSSPESKIGNSPVEETPKTKTASLPPRRINPMLRHRRRIEAERIRRRKSGDVSSEEKVKKMKEIMGVTSQWLSRIAQEDEPQKQQQERSQDTHHVAETPKEENVGEKCDAQTEEEAVSVEKTGECLVIQFKCNCSKTYQILLYGDACYYKLM